MKNTNRFEGFVTKLFILCLITGFATGAAPLFSADAQTVTIPDANLRTALESALNKAAGANITEAELSGLRQLDARNSSITTLTGLEKATDLRSINLKGNSVSDISPVVNLPRLRLLNVENNPLNYASLYTHIPAIELAMANRNNASVTYTARTPGTPAKISGDTQTGEPSATLANPFVVEVKDGANPAAVFAGVPVTFAVTAGGGTLSATSATTNASGRAETTLTLGSTAGANTVTASVTHAGTTVSVTFTATAESPNSAPAFTSGTTFSVDENSTAVGTVTASDADSSDSVTGYTLGGADSAEFSITDAGVLTFDAAPDYEFPGDATTNNEYIIVVTVTSGAGARALTATQTLTITVTDVEEAPGKPDAPAVTGADATPTELSVSWNAPTNTGPVINDYDVQYRAGTSGAFTDVDFTGIVTSTTLTGLTTGTSYQVQVRATNDEGTGSWSDAGTGTTATNVAPVFSSDTTAFSVDENSTAVGTVTASDADSSDSVTGYTITGGADSAEFSITDAGVLTFDAAPDYEFPGDATTNNEYIIVVTVTSGAGARALTATQTLTITVTDVEEAPGKPDAPAVTGADATPTELSVSWNAPTNTGPVINDYDVQYRAGTSGAFTDVDFTGIVTSTTLTGLTTGTSYQVQVRATNDEGTGSWSDAGTGTTATNVAPVFSSSTTAFSVNENSTAVTTATATDADASDTTVTYVLSGADSAAFSISTSGALTFSTAPDYENPTDVQSTAPANAATNREYIVTITATSGTRARQLSVSKTLTITVTDVDEAPGKPDAPTVDDSYATPTELSVSWTAPTNTGPAITDYDVRYRKGITGNFTDADYTGTATSMTLTGLIAGTNYQVQVRATNDEDTGPWSDAGSKSTAQNAAPTFSEETTTFSVAENSTFITPATARDADVRDTPVTYALSGADSAKFSISTSSALTFSNAPNFENPTDVQSITPANVASNNEYIVTITATSGTGARQLSVSKTLTITVTDVDEPPAKPDAPAVTGADATPTALSVSWTAPTNTGPAIIDYDVRYRKGTTGNFTDADYTGTTTSTTLTGLTLGTSYQVQVRATNDEGTGAWSAVGTGITADPIVSIPDANLREAINAALGATRAKNADITESEMRSLTLLRWNTQDKAENKKIRNLTGVGKATNLTELDVTDNAISNLTPLEDLTNLKKLFAGHNAISNLTPLEDLTNLTELDVDNNAISNLTPLEDLTNLKKLFAGHNTISDLTPLEDLTNLTELVVANNAVSDISPLKSNTGLGTRDVILLFSNPLSYSSIYTDIPALQARGATIFFTSRVPTTLTKISGDTQTGNPGATLANPFVVEVKDGASTAKPFAGVPVTFAVTAGGGTLSATSATTDANGRAQTKLTLGSTAGTNTVTASVTHATTTLSVSFTAAEANVAPTFTSPTTDTFSVAENTTAVTTVTATDADASDTTVTYALSGADRAAFSISTEGVLTFSNAPDFENPTDVQSTEPVNAASNNVYVVKVTATGGIGARALPSDPKTLTVTVTDVNEPPGKPDAPTVAAASHTSLNVTRTAPKNTGPAITGYDMRYREGTTGTFTEWEDTGTARTATITGLKPNTSYQVQVRAKNDEGTGPGSDAGTGKTDYQPEDVNRDDEVNVADLIAIGNHIGGTRNAAHKPDVNKDGTVNSADSQLVIRAALNNSNALTDIDGDDDVDVEDLVAFAATPVDVNGDTKTDDDDIKLIARLALNAAANRDAAPAPSQTHATLNAQNLQHLVHQALQRNRFDATYRRGVAALERILESLMIPEESALLHNYPNPFNPETWIPYQLASPAEVTLTLYDVPGRIVRTLNLGHQDAGMYRSKSRAAYWDGRNAQGEPVASGVYFYTLVAGEFTATGKMLIRK